jgi:hypothetical protein
VQYWGCGAAQTDPDGRFIGLWDHKSMRQHHADWLLLRLFASRYEEGGVDA